MSLLLSLESWMKTCLESSFFQGKNAYVLGWVCISEKNMPIVKLQVCNLILLSAAALSNKKVIYWILNLHLIDIFAAIMNADHCLLSKSTLSVKNSPIKFLIKINRWILLWSVMKQSLMTVFFLIFACWIWIRHKEI